MKKLSIITLALLVCFPLFSQAQKGEQIDHFIDLLNENHQFMGAVTIFESGTQKYAKVTGHLNIEDQIKTKINSRFRIGSISKTFTAVLVFKTIEAGDLSLNTNLSKFYPEIKNAGTITISQMLYHRSGIPNFTSSEIYQKKMSEGMTEKEVVDLITSLPVEIAPDTETSYSNSNYYLLSRILEKVNKKSYADLLNEKIVKPLALKATYYGKEINASNNEAHSYLFSSSTGSWTESSETDMSIPQGAGAIVSNTHDLAVFIKALFDGMLISEKSLQEMKAGQQGLGRGMMIFPFYDRMAYGHNGSIDGFESMLAYFPDDQTTIVILANGLNEYSFNNIGLGVLSYWFDKPFKLPDYSAQPVNLSVDQLKSFEGTFENQSLSMSIKLWVENEALMAQATGQAGFALTAYGPETFKFIPGGIEIKFNEDRSEFTLFQGGGEFAFVKK